MLKNSFIYKDKFLSTILKKNCYSIVGNLKNNFSFKKNSLYQIKIKLINKRQKNIIFKNKFKLIEENLIFFGKFKKKNLSLLNIEEVKKNKIKLTNDLFKFKNSRFFKDKKIPNKLSINLKRKWVNNFFLGKRGDKLYIIKKKNKIIGYLLLLIEKNLGIIDLINIKKKFRKKGYAKQMINYFFQTNKKIKYLQAGTQSSNKSAIKFYRSLGLKLKNKLNVYHLHT